MIRHWLKDVFTRGRYLYLASDASARLFRCRGRVLDEARGFRAQMQRRGLDTRLLKFYRGPTLKVR